MNIINLTPHVIKVIVDNKERIFEPSGTVARVATTATQVGNIDGIPVSKQTFGSIEGLPDPKPDTIYIVSAIVLSAAKEMGRTDVVAPDTANAIRNDAGQIVGVPGFVCAGKLNSSEIREFEYNDKPGPRQRKCFTAVVYAGKAYTPKEAEEKNLAIFQEIKYKKEGIWSNTTWRVRSKSATVVVFMTPFDGWPDDRSAVIHHVQKSCLSYTGYEPTPEEAWIAFQFTNPNTAARIGEKESIELA